MKKLPVKNIKGDIALAKDKLKGRVKRSGIIENFGQKDVQTLKNKYHYRDLVYGSLEERGGAKLLDDFDKWCREFNS